MSLTVSRGESDRTKGQMQQAVLGRRPDLGGRREKGWRKMKQSKGYERLQGGNDGNESQNQSECGEGKSRRGEVPGSQPSRL